MNKQKIMTMLSVMIITGSTLMLSPQIYAQTPAAGNHPNIFQELIAFISQKFNLDKTQVQTALTDFRNQRRANITPRPTMSPQQITDREKSRLDQLVTDKKISVDQENAILNELAALRTKYNLGVQNTLTPAERKTQMDNLRSEIVAWSQSQGIDSSYVMPGFGMGGRAWGMMEGKRMGGKGWGTERFDADDSQK